jgi:formiminotetrahydrofolate cyclodeaminase
MRGGSSRRCPVTNAVLDFDDYLAQLASAAPTPGGGSAATLVGALSAALVAMVARVTGERRPESAPLASDADALRARFLAARPRDEAAYQAVVDAQALPRAMEAEKAARTARLQAALAGAAEAPLAVASLASEAMALAERAAALRNAHLMSDVDCAVRFARATLEASVANVQVNHRFLKNPALVADQTTRLSAIVHATYASETRALAIVTSPPSPS